VAFGVALGSNCDLEDPVATPGKYLVRVGDSVEFEAVCEQGREVQQLVKDHLNQAPHPLFSARAKPPR
jgi:hypothetical protein